MGDSCPRGVVCADLASDTDPNNLSDFERVSSPLWTQFPCLYNEEVEQVGGSIVTQTSGPRGAKQAWEARTQRDKSITSH